MKHFGIAQWVDFTRGLVTGEDAAAMRRHAATCDECREISEYCFKLARACTEMHQYDVPDNVVRMAQSVFPVQFADRPKRSFRLPAELIFDSLLTPAAVGLRASLQVAWQALYRAGDCSLDLRIEPQRGSVRAAVVGRISNQTVPDTPMAGIPVCVKSGKLTVAETRSNQSGEFQMEYEQQKRLRLYVYLEGGAKSICVPLKQFAAEKPAAADGSKVASATRRRPQGAARQSSRRADVQPPTMR